MPELSKKEYQRKTEFELKKLQIRIVKLEKEIQKAETGIRTRHNQQMGQIRGHYAQTKEKLNEVQTSPQDTWLKLKPMLDEDIKLLDEAIEIVSLTCAPIADPTVL